MEEDKILKIIDKMPYGAPLYSSAFGKVTFNVIRYFAGGAKIGLLAKGGAIWYESSGKYRKGGEVTLYPSKEMRDWDKLAWKKGDVLTDDERFVIFKGFENDDYTEFFAPFEYNNNTFRQDLGLISNEFRKVNDDVAQEVIKKIEKHYSAKLNLETLKIEKHQKFKDGDIPEHEFEPFEKVLVRDQKTDKWTPDLYGSKGKVGRYNYICIGGLCVYCIPYEGNEHLLGTTNNPD